MLLKSKLKILKIWFSKNLMPLNLNSQKIEGKFQENICVILNQIEDLKNQIESKTQ